MALLEGVDEALVLCEYSKLCALEKVPEMVYAVKYCEQLTVVSAVTALCFCQLTQEANRLQDYHILDGLKFVIDFFRQKNNYFCFATQSIQSTHILQML